MSLTAWSLVGAVASRSLSLTATITCARVLGQKSFGAFGIVLNTSNTVASLAAMGLGVTATRYVADLRERDPERAGRIMGLAWMTSLLSGLLMMAVSLFASRWTAHTLLHADSLTGPIRIASLLILLNPMLAFQNGALAGLEAFRRLASINVISGLASVPLVLFGVWRFGITGAIVGTIAGQLLTWVLSERLLLAECRRAGIRLSLQGSLRETGVFCSFSLPALLGPFSTMPVMWICSVLIVRSPHGFEQMALYTAADRWRLAILFIPNALFQAALPMMANLYGRNRCEYREIARANLWINLGLVLVPVLPICLLAPHIMASYGGSFRNGWPVLALFAFATVPEALNTILGYRLVTQGRMWARFWYDVLMSATLLGLGAWLIPTRGTLGFAFAYLAAFTIASIALAIGERFMVSQEFETAVEAAPQLPDGAI